MKVAVVGHVEWIRFARVDACRPPARSRTRSRTGSRPGAGERVAAAPAGRCWPARRRCSPCSATTSSAARRVDELERRGVRVHARDRPGADALGVDAGGRGRRADDHDRRGEASPARVTTTGCPGTSSPRWTRSLFVAGDVDALVPRTPGPRARRPSTRELDDAAPRLGAARRAGRERGGRGRAVPPGRSRAGAVARRDDVRRARRLDAARRPVQRRAGSGRRRGRVRRRRLLRRGARVRAREPGSTAHEAVAFAVALRRRGADGPRRRAAAPSRSTTKPDAVAGSRLVSSVPTSTVRSDATAVTARGCVVGESGLQWGPVGDATRERAMFSGEYEHTLDDKSRVTLPARFRAALAGGCRAREGVRRQPRRLSRRRVGDGGAARIAELDPFSARDAQTQADRVRRRGRGRPGQAGARARARRPSPSTQGSGRTWSSRVSTTTSRSGTAPPGRSS